LALAGPAFREDGFGPAVTDGRLRNSLAERNRWSRPLHNHQLVALLREPIDLGKIVWLNLSAKMKMPSASDFD
jgi:hypothetical protein